MKNTEPDLPEEYPAYFQVLGGKVTEAKKQYIDKNYHNKDKGRDNSPLFEYQYRLKCLKCTMLSQSFYNFPTFITMFQILLNWYKT